MTQPDLEDGTVITALEDGTTYLVQGGQLLRVLEPGTVLRNGFDAETTPRVTLPSSSLLPRDPDPDPDPLPKPKPKPKPGTDAPPPDVPTRRFDSGDTFMGAGHFMHTYGSLNSHGLVAAVTRTRTITWFGGFHGSVHIIFADVNDAPVYTSGEHRFFADGTWVGRSDTTEAWFEQMDPMLYDRIVRVYVFHAWSPDEFNVILKKWEDAAEKVGALVATVGKAVVVVAAWL